MATSVEDSCGTRPDILGVNHSLTSTFHKALNTISLNPETLGSAITAASTIENTLKLSTHFLRQSATFATIARLNSAVMPALQQPTLSNLVWPDATRSLAAALDNLSRPTTFLNKAILDGLKPKRIAFTDLQDTFSSVSMQTISNESLREITRAITNVKLPIEAEQAVAAAQTAITRFTTDGSYEQVARRLIGTLCNTDEQTLPTQAFKIDALASAAPYDLIREHAPEVADHIDEEADRVRTSFLDRKLVRYSLAGLAFSLIVTLWVITTPDLNLIPKPWRHLIRSVAEGTGIGAPVLPLIAWKLDKSRNNSPQGTASEETEHN